MPANDDAPVPAAHSARGRHNRRPKITLDESELLRLHAAAKARGLNPAAFAREAVLAAVKAAEDPAAGKHDGLQATAHDKAATVRKKYFLTADENVLLKQESKAAGLLQQDYARLSVVAAMTKAPPPKRKVAVSRDELAHGVSMIAFQLKKLGTNLNQLAKQANTGLVPISDAELLYFKNYHQRVLTLASHALEKVLA